MQATPARMHENSLLIFRKHALSRFESDMRVLEIGPNGVPSGYQQVVDDSSISWETLDQSISLHQSLLRDVTYVATDEHAFPIPDARFDVVLSGQVLEHVRQPWKWMRELARVCKSGGVVITIVPVSWPYHEDPVDCWRVYPEGMRALHEEAGLDTELAVYEDLEPAPDPRRARWFLAKQAIKSFIGREPFLRPLVFRTVDTIAIARKP